MALPATAVIEVRTAGSDTQCAGGFNSARGGTDYSQQNAAQATGTVTSVTTTVTATTGIFTSLMVGNYITDGTTPKEITAFTSSTIVTVDSAPSWTGATIYVGGALATPGAAAAIAVNSNTIWIKTGTYTLANTSVNTAGGPINLQTRTVGGTNAARFFIKGYNSTRWGAAGPTASDLSNAPIFSAGAQTSVTLVTLQAFSNIENVKLDGNSGATNRGILMNAGDIQMNWCKVQNCKNNGINAAGSRGFIGLCEVTGCATSAAISLGAAVSLLGCYIHDNVGVDGCALNNDCALSFCTFDTNANGVTGNVGSTLTNCNFYGHTAAGVSLGGNSSAQFTNCIASGNATFGFSGPNGSARLLNCAGVSNTSGNVSGFISIGFVTLSGDPFVDAPNGNFALNNTASAGAACRAAGIPGVFPGALTTGYLDIGAAQHQDPATSGGACVPTVTIGAEGVFSGT